MNLSLAIGHEECAGHRREHVLEELRRRRELGGALLDLLFEHLGQLLETAIGLFAVGQGLLEPSVRLAKAVLHAVDVARERNDLGGRLRGQRRPALCRARDAG